MILTNTETVPGYQVERILGLVQGSTVRARDFGTDFIAGLRNLVGGELPEYTELLNESRAQSTKRMVDNAISLGANAVLNIRFSTSTLTQGAAEIYVYGTAAVVVEKGEA